MDRPGAPPALTLHSVVVASAREEGQASLGCYAVCSFLSRKTADFCWLLSSEPVKLVGSWLFTGGTLGAVLPPPPSEARRGGGAGWAPLRAPPTWWGFWRANGQPWNVLPSPPRPLSSKNGLKDPPQPLGP